MRFAYAARMFLTAVSLATIAAASISASGKLEPYAATPDRVLVIYNAEWKNRSEGTSADQDSRDIAEYYAAMHTDPTTGKKPYLLGLSCRHQGKKHLNDWVIREVSTDNRNGIVFKGKGPNPSSLDWLRDSRKVEIHVADHNADWNSLSITCRSEVTGEERIVTPLMTCFTMRGIPAVMGAEPTYPPLEQGKGRSILLDATKIFPGTVTISLRLKNYKGKTIRDLSLRYWDARDFAFSQTGPDGVPDDNVVEEDVLAPVQRFLEDQKNALPDGTLLKDYILYIVVVHGMPYAANGIFGIDHGATARRGNHGSLTSLEQRLQTIYYSWKALKSPIMRFYMVEGPDSEMGVINHIITTGYRNQLGGIKWNPYIHPDTYLTHPGEKKNPTFVNIPPLAQQRLQTDHRFFTYGVTRIDGSSVEEAKRLIDYAVYSTKYLRPEIDCRVRADLDARGQNSLGDLAIRLAKTETENLWGDKELSALGFIPFSSYDKGLPFLARPSADPDGPCSSSGADWKTSGFYPGGMGRQVVSHNGWNMSSAPLWQYLRQGVTVTAAGAPAYDGGPHITNLTFWDNAILTRYLFRGRDLGECFLRATWYVNWSTSLIGDPLFHPDLSRTAIDRTPPRASRELSVSSSADRQKSVIEAQAELAFSPDDPEVALLRVVARDPGGKENVAISALYSRRPQVTLKDLAPDTDFTLSAELVDPYGNRTKLAPLNHRTPAVNIPLSIIKDFVKGIKDGK
ncbi:MAG: hypothetical protein ED859_07385 [Desulfuromonadales bacterium]|nr:MAG: hypothetical protein ED859_07385 [Desulfuromonadales bacterium]